jgi:hypothetical protein
MHPEMRRGWKHLRFVITVLPWGLIAFVLAERSLSVHYADQFSVGATSRFVLLFDGNSVAFSWATPDSPVPLWMQRKWFRHEQFVNGGGLPGVATRGPSVNAPVAGRQQVWSNGQYWDVSYLLCPEWFAIAVLALGPLGYVAKRLGDRYLRKPLAAEHRCLRCGYDLAMTPMNSPCPECGLAAERSVIEHVHPDDCPPRWVWMIAIATLALLIAYLAVAAFFALTAATLEGALFLRGWYFFSVTSVVKALPAAFSFLLLAVIVHAAANILLSREDRQRPFSWPSFLHRWSLRILPLPPLAGAALGLLEVCSPSRTPGNPLDGWVVPLWLPLLVCPALTFFRLRQLAIRLGRRRLAEHISIVATGAVVSLLFLLLSSWIAADHFRRADTFFFVFGVLPFGLVALFNLWALLLLFVVARKFFRSAREATARWRAADAARPLESSTAPAS